MVSRLIYVQFRQRFLSLELREGRKFVATGLAGVDPAQPQWFSPMQAVLSEPAPGLHLLVRSAVAFLLVASCICLGWLVAWKLVLVHVPPVQEIFGLKKKPAQPKPSTLRFSRIYNRSSQYRSEER